jgi:hypothetical protein
MAVAQKAVVARRLAAPDELHEPAFSVTVYALPAADAGPDVMPVSTGPWATLGLPAAARGPPKDGRTLHSADCPDEPRIPTAGRIVVAFDRGDGPAPLASFEYAVPASAPATGDEWWAQLNPAAAPIVVQLRLRQTAYPREVRVVRVALRVACAGAPKPPSDADRALSI